MKSKLLFVLSKTEPACFKAVRLAVSGTQGFEVQEAAHFAEAQVVLHGDWVGLVIAVVDSKEDLAKAFGLLASKAEAIGNRKSIRVLVFNNISNIKVISTLGKQGAAEVLDFNVSGKTVIHKIQRHLKLIRCASGTEGVGTVQLIEPLTHPRDFWLLRPKADAKRVMARWMVEMMGPGPSAGEWDAISHMGESAYVWKARDSQGKFATPEGQWVFVGRSVEFDWRVNRWRFVGDHSSLTFVEAGKVTASRFVAESAELMKMAKNSNVATALLPEIEATYVAELQVLTSTAKPNEEGHDLLVLGPEEKTKGDWNENIGEDEKPADWNDHGARRQNIFNHGRGLGQGNKSDKVLYGPDDFSTGADAFKPIGVRIMVNSRSAEVIEQNGRSLKFVVSDASFESPSTVAVEIRTENMDPDTVISSSCRLLQLEAQKEANCVTVEVELDGACLLGWKSIQAAVEARQYIILEFLKMARGR